MSPKHRIVRFGAFELDLHSRELRKHGHRVRLVGQPVELLTCLLETPGEVVTREALQKRLWPDDTFVNFEHSLNAAVKRLRRALNDTAESPRFVETLPRRGYRFIASMQEEDVVERDHPPAAATVADDPEAGMERQRRGSWTIAAAVVLVVSIASAAWFERVRNGPSPIRSLAVLPLENLSADPSQEYFSEGLTDELITELGQIKALRVISRTSVMTYEKVRKPLPDIARELAVDAIVEGTVLRSGKRVRVTAQLIQAASDKHLWAESYESDLGDALAIQQKVARSIANEIKIELTQHEKMVLALPKRVNPESHEAYLKGRYFWNKRTADGLQKAIGYFNQAVDIDPTYAPAYSGLADSYALLGDWEYGVLAPREAYPKAKAAAAKALELDSELAEAHISLAFALDGFDWDFEAGGREFRRGLELNPGYATGHQWYAGHLTLLGNNSEAINEMKKAESLDPLSLIISADLAEDFFIARRYEEGVDQIRKTMEMDPSFPMAHYQLGQSYLERRQYGQAVDEFRKAVALSGGNPACLSGLGYATAVSGKKSEAEAILNDLKNRPNAAGAPEMAVVYAGLDQRDEAIAWLEKSYEARFNPGVLRRPMFDPLRSDARFADLMRRVGLVR
jgi:TolB-like protein/DNA-binding winged helix-turn-helix (wHTH) protein/Tfp pilus assembly protein PilF